MCKPPKNLKLSHWLSHANTLFQPKKTMQLHIKLQIRRVLMCNTMLLMVQKSWEHQLRLVVYQFIPLFTRFYKVLCIPVQVVIAWFRTNHQHPSPFKTPATSGPNKASINCGGGLRKSSIHGRISGRFTDPWDGWFLLVNYVGTLW